MLASTYSCQETVVLLSSINRLVSIVHVEECLLHGAEQVDPGFQLDLRLVGLGFSRHKGDELAFRRNVVSVRATEHVPAKLLRQVLLVLLFSN